MEATEENSNKKDFFKIKVAIFFGYNGLPFHGLQKNKDVRTIEEDLERALFDSELIPKCNFGDLRKTGWKRAARTDKGVHAISNVINCKLAIKKNYVEEVEVQDAKNEKDSKKPDAQSSKIDFKSQINFNKIINILNSNLKDVKVFAIRKVTKHFDSKSSARSRLYEYLIPISIFKKPIEKNNCSIEFENKLLEKINILTKTFYGTKNFHNFSRKMKAKDPKSKRYIIEFVAKIVETQDLMDKDKLAQYKSEDLKENRFLLFKITGQSFIYHQIRKMIGSLIQICQLDLPETHIENAFTNNIVKVWLAPPQGLFLNRVNFEAYNAKRDIPETLEFNEEEEKVIEKFRKEVIYPIIVESELKNKTFTEWLKIWLDPRNTIVEESEEEEGDMEG